MDGSINFLAIIIIIFLFFIIVIGLYFAIKYTVKPELYGQWSEPNSTDCIGSVYCSEVGEITTRQTCTPNPVTGFGCQNDNGEQTFAPRITIQECQLPCRSSIWKIDKTDCITDLPEDTCVITTQSPVFGSVAAPSEAISTGTQTITYTCVSHDPTGLNNCILIQPTEVITTTGEIETLYQSVVYNIGDVVTETNSCTNYQNPQCGQWTFYVNNNPSVCKLQLQTLSEQEGCIVNNNTNIYDILKEGYYLNTMNCKLENEVINVKNEASKLCANEELNQMGASCTTSNITPIDIKEGLIPLGTTAVLCPSSNSNPTTNPLCYQPCRLSASANAKFSSNSPFNFLLNSFIIIRKRINSSWAFLTTIQIPNIDGKILALRGPSTNPTNALTEYDDTPLIFITQNSIDTTPICSWEKITLNSSLISAFGVRSINGNQAEVQILSGVLRNYIGWLITNNTNQINWRQALTEYTGPGMNSDDANIFNLKINKNFTSTKIPNFSKDLLGSANANILNQGKTINVPVLNGSSTTLNDIQLLVFNSNIISAINPDICNIFIKK